MNELMNVEYMEILTKGAHVLLPLLNEMEKEIKCEALRTFYPFSQRA